VKSLSNSNAAAFAHDPSIEPSTLGAASAGKATDGKAAAVAKARHAKNNTQLTPASRFILYQLTQKEHAGFIGVLFLRSLMPVLTVKVTILP
jgi:hypothetical protein